MEEILKNRGYNYIQADDIWEKTINGNKYRIIVNGKGILPKSSLEDRNVLIHYRQINSEKELDDFEARASILDPSQV